MYGPFLVLKVDFQLIRFKTCLPIYMAPKGIHKRLILRKIS